MFYPSAVPSEIGFSLTKMMKALRKPHWKVSTKSLPFSLIFFLVALCDRVPFAPSAHHRSWWKFMALSWVVTNECNGCHQSKRAVEPSPLQILQNELLSLFLSYILSLLLSIVAYLNKWFTTVPIYLNVTNFMVLKKTRIRSHVRDRFTIACSLSYTRSSYSKAVKVETKKFGVKDTS